MTCAWEGAEERLGKLTGQKQFGLATRASAGQETGSLESLA